MNFQHFKQVPNKTLIRIMKEKQKTEDRILCSLNKHSVPKKSQNSSLSCYFIIFYYIIPQNKFLNKNFMHSVPYHYTIVMSSNIRVTRSKGKSDGLSLPARSRPRRKPTNMENDDGDTILNTTFDAGSSQHHPQTPVHTSPLRCQSTPPQTGTIRLWETPVSTVPVASQGPMIPRIPLPRSQDSNTSLSTLFAPLFTEDRCSSISNDNVEICDAEVTLINR